MKMKFIFNCHCAPYLLRHGIRGPERNLLAHARRQWSRSLTPARRGFGMAVSCGRVTRSGNGFGVQGVFFKNIFMRRLIVPLRRFLLQSQPMATTTVASPRTRLTAGRIIFRIVVGFVVLALIVFAI